MNDDRDEYIEAMPASFNGTRREWEDFVRGRQPIDVDPEYLAEVSPRRRGVRWAAWGAVIGALGFALASVLVR